MPINNITQTISTLPPAGARGVDVQTQFVIKQEDFQDHLQGITVTELNTFKDQLNTRIGEINSTVTTMNGYANTASTGASTATTKAGEASTSASQALTYKNQASTSATEAAASASSLTPSGILTAIKTVDGTGSGLDADLFDGLDSSEFMRKSTNNIITQNIIFNNGTVDTNGLDFISNVTDKNLTIDMYNGTFRIFRNGGSQNGVIPFSIGVGNSLYSDNGTNGNGRILTTTTPIGYASGMGVGGIVVQDLNKLTAVTLNKLTGRIVMNNAALANGATVIFTVNNSMVANTDLIYVSSYGFGYNYRVEMHWITDGQFQISVTNKSGATLSEALSINFAIFKGANS
jgi:hypothetical protein